MLLWGCFHHIFFKSGSLSWMHSFKWYQLSVGKLYIMQYYTDPYGLQAWVATQQIRHKAPKNKWTVALEITHGHLSSSLQGFWKSAWVYRAYVMILLHLIFRALLFGWFTVYSLSLTCLLFRELRSAGANKNAKVLAHCSGSHMWN